MPKEQKYLRCFLPYYNNIENKIKIIYNNTKLKDIDLTNCIIDRLSANINDVKGLIVSEFQVLDLAYLLRIKIKK